MNFWENMINKRFSSRVIGILLSGVMVFSIVSPVFADDNTRVLSLGDVLSKIDTEDLTNVNLNNEEAQLLRDILQQIDSGTMNKSVLGDIDLQVLRDILWQIDAAAAEKAKAEAEANAEAEPEPAPEPEPQEAEETPEQVATDPPASDPPVTDTGANEAPATPAESASPAENTQPPEKTITAPEEITEPVEPEEDVDEEPVLTYPDGITNKGSDEAISLPGEQIDEILYTLPEGLSAERVGVVLNAYSLVNKVNYFWGGKSNTQGWDERWGNIAYVTSGGSSSSGTYRPYGLDCSGYVAWAFCNTAGYTVTEQLGISTRYQWGLSQETAWEDAQPGDLAFFYDPNISGSINHIGIVVGWDVDGELLVAHCSSSKNTVAVTRAAATGFKYIRTPDIYSDESFVSDGYSYKGLGTYLLWQSTKKIEITDAEPVDTESEDTALEDTEPVVLTIDDIKIGDLIFSENPTWGTEATVGIVTGYDDDGNLLVSYPTKEDDSESAVKPENADDPESAADDAEDTDSEESEIVSVPIDQLDYTNVRRIESSEALSYLKGDLPIYKMKTIYGGKEVAEKAKNPYEMDEPEDNVEMD